MQVGFGIISVKQTCAVGHAWQAAIKRAHQLGAKRGSSRLSTGSSEVAP